MRAISIAETGRFQYDVAALCDNFPRDSHWPLQRDVHYHEPGGSLSRNQQPATGHFSIMMPEMVTCGGVSPARTDKMLRGWPFGALPRTVALDLRQAVG